MKAIVSTRYGAPEVLQLATVPKPTPKDNEVLIRIYAATTTPSDTAFRKGDPFIIKLMYGLRKPRLAIGGVEFSGEIEAIGKDVQTFKVGDQVFGMSPNNFGTYAEYKCLPESGLVVKKSPKMRYEDATAVCDGATTALTFLRNVAKIQRGQKILINGASGSVGAYAVQLAKYYGAHVTGVCSGVNVELVKSLGADAVIDYTKHDFTQNHSAYDVIFDAVGKSSFAKCKGALTPTGIYMTTVPSLKILRQMIATRKSKGKRASFTTAGLKQSKENLLFLTDLYDKGVIRSVIDRCYPLEEIVEAHRYVDTGRKKGNVIITV